MTNTVAEEVFTVPTVAFIAAMAAVIVGGLIRSRPAVPLDHHLGPSTEAVGVLLVLKAFASGCSALTGVEAIANAVPQFRRPRARRAQRTEVWLGILLGAMPIGLGAEVRKFDVVPHSATTVLAQLAQASVGHNAAFYAIQLITMVLLALAANTSFGLPVLAALLAKDNFLPHMFALRADRQVHRYGVIVLALAAAALLVAAKGDTQALVPLFAVGVFIGFTLSQVGMVKHWASERTGAWRARAAINGTGGVLTAATTIIELVSKFTEGAWLIVIVIPALVLMMSRIHRTYGRLGRLLGLGEKPKPPSRKKSLVVVPVGGMSRLTVEGISAALSLGDDVIAVTVCFTDDPEDVSADVSFRDRWNDWHPNVPLITLRTSRRSITKPIVHYLCQIEAEDHYHRLVVLIPEVQPTKPWYYPLHNQRGVILERAIRRGTLNVVLCRLRYRLDQLAPHEPAPEAQATVPPG